MSKLPYADPEERRVIVVSLLQVRTARALANLVEQA